MADIFDNTILCKNCNTKMQGKEIEKDGFSLRAVECTKCGNKIIHPQDLKEYNDFKDLKSKTYRVKLRLVGNSYAVSIPKEIVEFMHEQESVFNDMVNLCFDNAKRLSLMFGEDKESEEDEK